MVENLLGKGSGQSGRIRRATSITCAPPGGGPTFGWFSREVFGGQCVIYAIRNNGTLERAPIFPRAPIL